MAVAVKNPTPVGSARPFNRLPVVSLVGVAYLVACLGIIFSLIPLGWRELITALHGNADSYAAGFGLGVLMLAATIGVCILGGRLLGADQPAGARAGILIGFVGLLLSLLLTRWGSGYTEHFADGKFFGPNSETVGIILTLVIAALCIGSVLLYLFNFNVEQFAKEAKPAPEKSLTQRIMIGCLSAAVAGFVGFLFVTYGPGFEGLQKEFYQFLSVFLMLLAGLVALLVYTCPAAHRHMIEIENQGWLSARSYKPLQGVRVRRATIIGLLLMVAAGIYSMMNHNLLSAQEWKLIVPFTQKFTLLDDGDLGSVLDKDFPGRVKDKPLVVDHATWLALVEKTDARKYKMIAGNQPYITKFHENDIVTAKEYASEIQRLKDPITGVVSKEKRDGQQEQYPPDEEIIPVNTVQLPSHVDENRALTLLPNVKYTVGLLLLPMIALWLAWRVINLPAFADFLIATEAEMNKVSWTTKKRLYQDTIVVLVTVLMMAAFLFTVDMIWSQLLSWKQIGVIVSKPDDGAANKHSEEKPW